MAKIDIIIPVYNVQDYLEKCLDSVINQTFKDIEIICINDGSTDNSLQILEKYASKDSRIKIINQHNKGISTARNVGISYSTSEYITFLDSDDYFELTALEKAYNKITENDVDIVCYYSNIVNNGLANDSINIDLGKKYHAINFIGLINIDEMIIEKTTVTCWNKLFKKAIIEKYNIDFPVGQNYEDCTFTILYMLHCQKAYYIDEYLHNYVQRPNSIMEKTFACKANFVSDYMLCFDNIYNHCKKYKLISKWKNILTKLYSNYLSLSYRYSPEYYKEEIKRIATKFSNNYDKEYIQTPTLKFIKNKQYDKVWEFGAAPYPQQYTFWQKFFSIRNEYNNYRKHKVLTILGIKIKFNKIQKLKPHKLNKEQIQKISSKRVLVHFHLFYHEQIDYYIEKLSNINSCKWDLYVTYIEKNIDSFNKIKNLKPDAKFIKIDNIGYDVWPFIEVIKSINLDEYDYVLKIHTKNYQNNNIYGGGYSWRDILINTLLKSKTQFLDNLADFTFDNKIGMICCKRTKSNTITGEAPEDKYLLENEIKKLNFTTTKRLFCAGTMFIIKSELLKYLKQENIQKKDFTPSTNTGCMSTLAHVYERLLCIAVSEFGYKIYFKNILDEK